jgi:hypothetical protein
VGSGKSFSLLFSHLYLDAVIYGYGDHLFLYVSCIRLLRSAIERGREAKKSEGLFLQVETSRRRR